VDHLGTSQRLTNAQGETTWRMVSEAFGKTFVDTTLAPTTTGTTTNNLRFPGQYEDQETGTYYNYFRDYDPATGRYVQSDPTGLDGGINTFVYVVNTPLSLIDPDAERPTRPQQRYQSPYGVPPQLPSTRELRRAPQEAPAPPFLVPNPASRDMFGRLADRPLENDRTPGVYPGINIPWTLPTIPEGCFVVCPKKLPNMCAPGDDGPCRVECGPRMRAN
jgi:RHS repeat-associated protein